MTEVYFKKIENFWIRDDIDIYAKKNLSINRSRKRKENRTVMNFIVSDNTKNFLSLSIFGEKFQENVFFYITKL